LGSPIDFVVFDGLNDGEVKGIIFIEVKTGASSLNTRERKIKDAVEAGNVQWVELRPWLELNQASQTTSNPAI
jgi:predicted Holliday junction resolvase-like endonuclease